MGGDLTGVKRKIERAHHHLAELRESLEDALDASTERFSSEFDPQTGEQVYRAHGLPTIDPRWALMVGDVLHNLRSALDHLAWQLVILDGGEPGTQTQFPVRGTPFNEVGDLTATQLRPSVRDARILDALEACQPYRGADGRAAQVDRNPLWLLHRLNIIDKHRLLLVVVCALNSHEMWWGGDSDMPVPSIKVSLAPVDENSPVAWFGWGDAQPPADFDPHLSLTVSFHEPAVVGKLRMQPIKLVDLLDSLCNWVEWEIVMPHFEPLFA